MNKSSARALYPSAFHAFHNQSELRRHIVKRMPGQHRANSSADDFLRAFGEVQRHHNAPVPECRQDERKQLVERVRGREKDHGSGFGAHRFQTLRHAAKPPGPTSLEEKRICIHAT